jgi:hypothetical protein
MKLCPTHLMVGVVKMGGKMIKCSHYAFSRTDFSSRHGDCCAGGVRRRRARAAKDWVAHRNWSQSQDNQLRRHALLLAKWGATPSEATFARALHLAAEKEESKANLYWSENRGFDPFLFVYW